MNADFTTKTTKIKEALVVLIVFVVKKSPLTFQALTAEEELLR